MATSVRKKKCLCVKELTPESFRRIDEVIGDYRDKPGGLIPVLQIVQGIVGYLPDEVINYIAEKMGKPVSEVAGVMSFYSFFSRQPKGKYAIRVCLGTACYVRGGKDILEGLKKELKVDVGDTTKDQLFTLEVGRCFGACGLAPVVMVNEETHRRVKPHKLAELIDSYRTRNEADAMEARDRVPAASGERRASDEY